LAGRDAGCREVGRQVGRGIAAGCSGRRPTGEQGLHLGWCQRGECLPDDGLISLDRRCQARRNLGLKRFLVGLKCLEIRLKLGARRLEALSGKAAGGNAIGGAWEREVVTRATGSAGELEVVSRPMEAFHVQRVYEGSGIGSFTRGSIPSSES